MTSTKMKCDQFQELTASELTSVAGGHFTAFLMAIYDEIREGYSIVDMWEAMKK